MATAQVVSSSKAQQESDDLLAKFWELEEPPQNDNLFTPEEQRVEQHYQDNHVYLPDEKRYQVKRPRTVGNLQLGESKTQAINRARSNEISLIRKQSWPAFQTVIQEYLELGHAQPVSPDDLLLPSSACYYMPIHSVCKQSSSTTKVRAVFDVIAKSTSQISLNDQLAVGPTIQPTLEQTLLRFRTYAVAVSGDISKIYREVVLAPEERSFHRFIWRAAPTDPWREFQMNRVTFGVTASPYLAVKTLQQVARDFGSSLPQASYHIENSFYVDDFFGGADNPQEAIALQEDTRSILSHAGFQHRRWRSSSSKVLEKILSEILEPLPNQKLVDTHSASYPKALGLIWDSREDTMATSVELPTAYSSTKRGVVSDIARTFDILGWLSPVILPMKVLYRKLWVKKLDWDQEVPDELKQQHEKWRSELHLLVEVRLPRHYFNKRKPLTVSLHGFSDASKLAFAGVIYIRATYLSGPPSSLLVASKTRVAPLIERSIPELELCGAHLLAKLLTTTSKTLGIPVENIHAYSDSTIVLAWLDGTPQSYVANRITKTIRLTAWKYVPTSENPADCASRGLTARELVQHQLWWHGPQWLLQHPVKIPAQPTASQFKRAELEDDQKHDSPTQQCSVVVVQTEDQLESRSNSFSTLIKITCWVRRFMARARKKDVPTNQNFISSRRPGSRRFIKKEVTGQSFPC